MPAPACGTPPDLAGRLPTASASKTEWDKKGSSYSKLRLIAQHFADIGGIEPIGDRKSTRLNSSHVAISYAVFCLKKKSSGARAELGRSRDDDRRLLTHLA